MPFPLANADSSDATQMKFMVILSCAAGIAIVGGLAALVIALGRRTQHRYADHFLAAAMFWGLLAVGSIAYTTYTQLSWSQQHFLEILSGYGNPQEASPALPWAIWTALAAFYVALLGGILWNRF